MTCSLRPPGRAARDDVDFYRQTILLIEGQGENCIERLKQVFRGGMQSTERL